MAEFGRRHNEQGYGEPNSASDSWPEIEGVRGMIVTTSNDIADHRVVRYLGVVRGITVRSRSVLGTIGASLQSLLGGNITLFTQLAEKAREEAYELMEAHAAEKGANAVIAMRYDANEMAAGITEVLAYGTAVVVEPVK